MKRILFLILCLPLLADTLNYYPGAGTDDGHRGCSYATSTTVWPMNLGSTCSATADSNTTTYVLVGNMLTSGVQWNVNGHVKFNTSGMPADTIRSAVLWLYFTTIPTPNFASSPCSIVGDWMPASSWPPAYISSGTGSAFSVSTGYFSTAGWASVSLNSPDNVRSNGIRMSVTCGPAVGSNNYWQFSSYEAGGNKPYLVATTGGGAKLIMISEQ